MLIANNTSSIPGQASKLRVVTGQHIAKATRSYPIRQRAKDAGEWVTGRVLVKPTAKMACEVFGISYPRLWQALQTALVHHGGRDKPHSKSNGNGTGTLSDVAVEHIIIELGVEQVWRVLDKLTQPQLPAAE